MSEIDDALDAIEAGMDGEPDPILDDAPEITGDDEGNIEALDDAPPELDADPAPKAAEDNPPGYLNYEQWIEAGKDPDDYRGKNAYSAHHDALTKSRGLEKSLNLVNENLGEWKRSKEAEAEQRIEQAKADAQARLESAIDLADTPEALKAQKELADLETKAPPKAAPQANPLITEFFAKNPMADRNSSSFNQDYYDDVSAIHNSTIQSIGDGATDAQIARSLDLAKRKANELHPEKFVSPRNNRKAAPSAAPGGAQKKNYSKAVKAIKTSSRNARDTNAASDIYEMIKETGGQEAADRFAKNIGA